MPCSSPAYKIFLGIIWLGWIVHAFFFAPQQEVAGMAEIMQLAQMDTSAFDASVIALFNLMGVWPMIMAAILLTDGRGQRLPALRGHYVYADYGTGSVWALRIPVSISVFLSSSMCMRLSSL